MATDPTSGIVGTDGLPPVYEPTARWTTWALKDVYMGGAGKARYVPKIGDYVEDTDTHLTYICVDIDMTTLLSTLVRIREISIGDVGDEGMLQGSSPATFRAYLDKRTIPHVMCIDGRNQVHGTQVTHCRVFRGNILDGSAHVISMVYDESGTFVGQQIPLELVKMANGLNKATWAVPPFYTTEDMPDGEVVVAVFYTAANQVYSKQPLIVENSAFIHSSDKETRYVTGIDLESPWLSTSNPGLIEFPLNVTMNSINMMGVVNYSDGSKRKLPVDGGKFSMFGLSTFVATQVGQKLPLTLRYQLSENEVAYEGFSVGAGKHISRTYRGITTNVDGNYSVKLYPYPVWVDAVSGYRLRWFMLNLDRNILFDVTPHVSANPGSTPFTGTLYGSNQRLSVRINLQEVNGSYKRFWHIQTVDVALMRQGTERSTNWLIAFDPNQSPVYGEGLHASTEFVNQNQTRVTVHQGAATLAEWLDKLYYNSRPLTDPGREIAPEIPDYFVFINGTDEIEIPISQWNKTFISTRLVPDNSTVFVKFVKKTATTDLILGISGMPVYQNL